ncbi:MAG: hypothetical protein ACOZIN_03280 [Myxococcota bacterium]
MSSSLRWATVLAVAALGCGPSKPPAKGIGEPCAPVAADETSAECADGLCVALDSASGFCTLRCTDNESCPSDFLCQAAGRFGKVCRKLTGCKTDGDCPAGHSCNPDTANCYIKVSRTLCSPCQDVAQCPAGGACFTAVGSLEQFCTAPCDASGGCPLGFSCQDIPAGEGGALLRQCVPTTQSCNFGKSLCAPCAGDAECGGPFDLCVRNVVSGETFCGRDCNPKKNVCPVEGCVPEELDSAENPECPGGFSCTNIGKSDDPNVVGPHQCVPNSNTCQGWCDAADEPGQLRQCGLGQECHLASNSCRPAVDGRMCAPCIDNDDCRKGSHPENRCIVNECPDCPFKGEAFCATQCADDAACQRSFGPGFVCRPVTAPSGATATYCMPQRGTCQAGLGRLGDDCSVNGAADCVAGVCLVAGRSSLCSLVCSQDADCGDTRYRCCEYTADGYDCSEDKRSPDGPLSGAGVCAPLGGLFGDDCTPGRPPCQTGTCLDLGTARVCTLPCAQGCPAGFACRAAQLAGASGTFEVCFPEGGGQVGADCTFGPAACESGLCIRKDSGPICTSSCVDDSACPEEWRCESVRAVDDTAVQACIPPALQ